MGYHPEKYWNNRLRPNKNDELPERVQELIDDYLASKERQFIFDAGCGTGRMFDFYPDQAKVIGADFVDTYREQILEKAKNYDFSFLHINHDLTDSLPFYNDTFTHCLAIKVLMHIPNPKPVLDELARVSDSVFICDTWREGEKARHVTVHDYQELLDEYVIEWYEEIGSHNVIVYSKPQT